LLSVCLYVYPPIVAREQLGKHAPAATNTRNNRRIVEGVVFYAVHVVLKGDLWVYELLEASFSMRSVTFLRKVGD
jgi:hypothetical protein